MLNCLAASFLSPALYRKTLKFKLIDGSALKEREARDYKAYYIKCPRLSDMIGVKQKITVYMWVCRDEIIFIRVLKLVSHE